VYGHVDGSVLLSFSCSSFTCGLYVCAEMSEFHGCSGKFIWPNSEPKDWKVTWELVP
jgi:hypothetical protein